MQPNSCAVRKIQDDMSDAPVSGTSRKNDLPPELIELIWPALQVGAVSGTSGLLVGSISGVLRSTTPTLFALASGIQWFTLGFTFWGTRGFVLHASGKECSEPKDKISASGIAGGIAGAAGGLLRSRRNIVPGAIMFAILGAAGQVVYNKADARHAALSAEPVEKNVWMKSKWSPIKVLSDEDYGKMLEEKLLRVNAEIALVDDSIESLRAQRTSLTGDSGSKI